MISYVFKRYEFKYLLTTEQYRAIYDEIKTRLMPDTFGKTVIQSLYYDTPDNLLVRKSNEKPVYKEKLRLRCYGLNDNDKNVYIEMKRKYDGIVYKRRIACKENEVCDILNTKNENTQIKNELKYFFEFYGNIVPKMLILYDREAFFDAKCDLRITFDADIRYRVSNLNFHTSLDGKKIFSDNTVLMEIKSGTALPLWLCDMLCNKKIYKQSFSKYGTAYRQEYEKMNYGVKYYV